MNVLALKAEVARDAIQINYIYGRQGDDRSDDSGRWRAGGYNCDLRSAGDGGDCTGSGSARRGRPAPTERHKRRRKILYCPLMFPEPSSTSRTIAFMDMELGPNMPAQAAPDRHRQRTQA